MNIFSMIFNDKGISINYFNDAGGFSWLRQNSEKEKEKKGRNGFQLGPFHNWILSEG